MKTIWSVFLLVLFISCNGPHGQVEKKPTDEPTAIRIAMRRGIDSFNPYLSTSLEGEIILKRLFPSLFLESIGESRWEPELTPNILKSIEWDELGKLLTVQLKDGLKWSDGESVSTKDLAYTFEIQKDPDVGWIGSASKKGIESWEVISPIKMVIHFSEASPYNLLDLNEGLIIPMHYFSQWKAPEWKEVGWGKEMVVFGPYMIGDILENEKLTLKPINAEAPRLGFAIIREKEMHYQLLHEKQIDYSWTLPASRLADIKNEMQPALFSDNSFAFIAWNPIDVEEVKGREFKSLDELEETKMRSPHPVLGDKLVRKALTAAMNRSAYVERFLPGTGAVPLSPWSLFSKQLDKQIDEQNLELAAEILQGAGWLLDGEIRKKGTIPLKFTVIVNAGNVLRENLLLAIGNDLRKIGVQMDIKMMEGSLYIQACFNRDFDAAFNVLRAGTHPDLKELFHSDAALNSGFNFTSWTSIDSVIDEMITTKEPKQILALARTAQEVFADELPLTILYRGTRIAAFSEQSWEVRPTELDPLFMVHLWRKTHSQND